MLIYFVPNVFKIQMQGHEMSEFTFRFKTDMAFSMVVNVLDARFLQHLRTDMHASLMLVVRRSVIDLRFVVGWIVKNGKSDS